ncbi:hypothetical protein STEG23_011768 [Scotinomys teguina]
MVVRLNPITQEAENHMKLYEKSCTKTKEQGKLESKTKKEKQNRYRDTGLHWTQGSHFTSCAHILAEETVIFKTVTDSLDLPQLNVPAKHEALPVKHALAGYGSRRGNDIDDEGAKNLNVNLKVRSFSTSVVRPFTKLVRPPVQIYGIEGRYATALYSAASKQNKLDQVEKELLRVGQLLKDPKVSLAVLNPYIKRSIKVKSLKDITTKEKFSPLTANLMRWSVLFQPLDEAILSELKTVLQSFLSQGQILKLEVKTDPSIMGGMIVRIGEKYVDMSAKTKIQKLGKAIRDLL